MLAYASRTGTRRNLAALRQYGWRLMVVAGAVLRHEGFPYALDNGAWSAHQQGRPFDFAAFEKAVERLGAGADFVVVPDIVGGGLDSLRFSEQWLPRLDGVGSRRLLAVQDGMGPDDVAPMLGDELGIFVGGSTEWKLRTIPQWARCARERGAWCHVGRVNTARRISLCSGAGVDSFDGTSVTRFAKTIRMLDGARRQKAWIW